LCQRSERIWLNHGTLLGIVIWTLWFWPTSSPLRVGERSINSARLDTNNK
jgi:hypothetical protein